MIIADTSVWIDYLNGNDNEYTNSLDTTLVKDTVALGDLIFLEILQGFKIDKEYRRAKTTLNTLDLYEMFGHNMVIKCAENYPILREKGITIRRTTDMIIASFCINNKIPLLFSETDFIPFVKELGLVTVPTEI